MSVFDKPKQAAMKVLTAVSPAGAESVRGLARQPQENEALRQRLESVENELRELRTLVDTLNRDLDESRRLNLRAAELMDVAFSQLAS